MHILKQGCFSVAFPSSYNSIMYNIVSILFLGRYIILTYSSIYIAMCVLYLFHEKFPIRTAGNFLKIGSQLYKNSVFIKSRHPLSGVSLKLSVRSYLVILYFETKFVPTGCT
uniref:Uncharacterized protein n=1 Tax=Cacopsylla melanoneura TaxID=428564 RepID=A0A8D9FCL5_9HEMI